MLSFKDLFATWNSSNNSSATHLYGFDFNMKCSCPALLDDFEVLKYFINNPLVVDPEMLPAYLWPSLMMGPAGTRSGFHADDSFLPFWITVLQGRKRFRIITYSNWSKHLHGFFVNGGGSGGIRPWRVEPAPPAVREHDRPQVGREASAVVDDDDFPWLGGTQENGADGGKGGGVGGSN